MYVCIYAYASYIWKNRCVRRNIRANSTNRRSFSFWSGSGEREREREADGEKSKTLEDWQIMHMIIIFADDSAKEQINLDSAHNRADAYDC
jgi:hypothetical protein